MRGDRYDSAKRMHVLQSYFTILNETGKVVSTKLADAAKVSTKFAWNFIRDFEVGRPVLGRKRAERASHPGMYTLDTDDKLVLLEIFKNDPQTPLHEYQEKILLGRSKLVSFSTICRY